MRISVWSSDVFFSDLDFLLGRFGGGVIATFAIMLAMAIGLYVGSLMPWLDSSRLGPTPWLAYAWAFGVLVLPNLLLVSSLMFLLATLTRSMLYTYQGVLLFFVLWSMSGSFTSDLVGRWIGALLCPAVSAAVHKHHRPFSSAHSIRSTSVR